MRSRGSSQLEVTGVGSMPRTWLHVSLLCFCVLVVAYVLTALTEFAAVGLDKVAPLDATALRQATHVQVGCPATTLDACVALCEEAVLDSCRQSCAARCITAEEQARASISFLFCEYLQ